MGTIVEMELSNGETRTFTNEDVVSAHILDVNNPLNTELPIGTLDLVLYSAEDIFNFLNPNGIYKYMKQGQKINIYYEFKDGVTKQLGQYYLDEWYIEEEHQARILAVDTIGLLEKHIFREDYTLKYGESTRPINDLFESSGYSGNIEYSYGEARIFPIHRWYDFTTTNNYSKRNINAVTSNNVIGNINKKRWYTVCF